MLESYSSLLTTREDWMFLLWRQRVTPSTYKKSAAPSRGLTKKQAQNKLEKMCGDMRLTVAYPICCAYTKPEHVRHVLRSS